MEKLDMLMEYFLLFTKDSFYYENLIIKYGNLDFDALKEKVIMDIQKSWECLDNAWFIDFLNLALDKPNSLEEIANLLKKFKIDLNFITLKDILKKCPRFNGFLQGFFEGKEKITQERIEADFKEKGQADILIIYGLYKNLLFFEEEKELSCENSNDIYFRDLNAIAKLGDEEQNDAIRTFGIYKKMLLNAKTEEERKALEKKVLYYKNKLVEANMPLVISVAKKYFNSRVDFLDLVQEGTLGLMHALDKFDYELGFQLSTYAWWFIRQSITKYISTSCQFIKLPSRKHALDSQIRSKISELQMILDREPTAQEVALDMNIDVSDVEEVMYNINWVQSLDANIRNDEKSDCLYSLVRSKKDDFEQVINSVTVEQLLTYLTVVEEFVIRMRYGIKDGKDKRFNSSHTLEEIGKELGLVKETIRLIKKGQLKKCVMLLQEFL